MEDDLGLESTYIIVGIDEAEPSRNRISWVSPMARALMKARVGDVVNLMTPVGKRELEILEVKYEEIA